jgi:hypothetical protein
MGFYFLRGCLACQYGMPTLRTAVHKLIILCCALYLSGAHWMVLQTTAWTGMLISRSLNVSVAEAIDSTFDGQHPCRMCEAISSGHQTEERSQKEFELLKKGGELKFLEFCVLSVLPRLGGTTVPWPELVSSVVRRTEAPPTPPPLA